MKLTKSKLKKLIKEEFEAHGWQSEEDRAPTKWQDEQSGEERHPYAHEFAKDLFDKDRPKLLEFYREVVSPWSRDGNGYEEGSKEKYKDGLEKHAPWLGNTRHDSPSLNTPSTSKLMSGTDVRHYLREFHKQIVNLYGEAINNADERSQERLDLLREFQGILEETKGVQASYIVNVLNIPELDYLKDRTKEGGDNMTLGGYLNESELKRLIKKEMLDLLMRNQ
jgi:hypothetical protein